MRSKRFVLLSLLASGVLLSGVTAYRSTNSQSGPVPLPERPEGVPVQLIHAQAFVLEEPYVHYWRREQPLVDRGLLLVLATDPALLQPRQTYEAVLYVGDQTAERVNVGASSGHLICLVPHTGPVSDLFEMPIWFGSPELPERVDAATIAEERARATAEGLLPLLRTQVEAALARGGSEVLLDDRTQLDRHAVQLVAEFAPDEADLIDTLLVPVVR